MKATLKKYEKRIMIISFILIIVFLLTAVILYMIDMNNDNYAHSCIIISMQIATPVIVILLGILRLYITDDEN